MQQTYVKARHKPFFSSFGQENQEWNPIHRLILTSRHSFDEFRNHWSAFPVLPLGQQPHGNSWVSH